MLAWSDEVKRLRISMRAGSGRPKTILFGVLKKLTVFNLTSDILLIKK